MRGFFNSKCVRLYYDNISDKPDKENCMRELGSSRKFCKKKAAKQNDISLESDLSKSLSGSHYGDFD